MAAPMKGSVNIISRYYFCSNRLIQANNWVCHRSNNSIKICNQKAVCGIRWFASKPKANRILDKMLKTTTRKGKKTWYENLNVTTQSFIGPKQNQISSGLIRRSHVLSKVMHGYVSAMIDSGEVEPRLLELGLEISEVKLSSDCTSINIYWITSGNERDDIIESFLPDAAHVIRQKLINMRVMGHLPPVQFVKNKSIARLQEVEKLLKIADMGDDYERTSLDLELRDDIIINISPTNLQDDLNKSRERFSMVESQKYRAPVVINENKSENKESTYSSKEPQLKNETFSESHRNDKFTVDNNTSSQRESDVSKKSSKYAKLNMRSDIYELNHSVLLKDVQEKVRKTADRSYQMPSEQLPFEKIKNDQLQIKNIKKMLQMKKKTTKLGRAASYGLASSMEEENVAATWRNSQPENDDDDDYHDYDDDRDIDEDR